MLAQRILRWIDHADGFAPAQRRFHFYSNEGHEPPHIHVRTGEGECKFWLSPVRLARVDGVRPTEVRRIEVAVIEHEALFLEKWHEHSNG
ncbi:MAG: DUF4160 domain-containing protein [Rhodocyclaceae bacterium]|nr:DUF4160 domain-containing protein [Rhodocyclaceae bacterium]